MSSLDDGPPAPEPEGGSSPIPLSWPSPPPRAVPQLRRRLAGWLDKDGAGFYQTMILIGRQHLAPPGRLRDSARALATAERGRVALGDLYWVSPEMAQLAHAAGEQLDRPELYRHDLPSPCGLMVWSEPLATYTNSQDRAVQIVAASWGPWPGPGPNCGWDLGGIWITFYAHPAPHLPVNASPDDPAIRELARRLAPIMPDNEAGWPFGALPADQRWPEGTTAPWARTLCAAWLLMRQPLAAVTRARTGKARRTRHGDRISSTVHLIHVRRRTRPPTTIPDTDGTVERAGPDDKPVRGVERVQVWDR